jgi:ubiquinone/menaquinone biosynthesis C-methylase UbiE
MYNGSEIWGTRVVDATSARLHDKAIELAGMSGDLATWLRYNLDAMETPESQAQLAAFPPPELMQITTGLTEPLHFAQHGVHFLEQLELASETHLSDFKSVLDFGCGVGRLARLFKGFKGRYTGVDVDSKTVAWVREALPHVSAYLSAPREALPFAEAWFDCAISISVFTHMTEADQRFYLSELQRVVEPGGTLLLTVHGKRALHRALTEDFIFNLVWCPRDELEEAQASLSSGSGYKFIRQLGHLTTADYDYGITFIGTEYINNVWSEYFDVISVRQGAIHDFQDIVTLRRR